MTSHHNNAKNAEVPPTVGAATGCTKFAEEVRKRVQKIHCEICFETKRANQYDFTCEQCKNTVCKSCALKMVGVCGCCSSTAIVCGFCRKKNSNLPFSITPDNEPFEPKDVQELIRDIKDAEVLQALLGLYFASDLNQKLAQQNSDDDNDYDDYDDEDDES